MKNSLSITRYKVFGPPLNSLSTGDFDKCLQKYMAPPFVLKPESREEISYGWQHPESEEEISAESIGKPSVWDTSLCQIPGAFRMKIRVEFKKIPASLLNLVYKNKIKELSLETDSAGAPKSKFVKLNKKEIREEIKQELFSRALPELKFIEVVWYHNRDEIVIDTTAKKYCEIFENLFFHTFHKGLKLEIIKIIPLFHVPLNISGDIANLDGYDIALG